MGFKFGTGTSGWDTRSRRLLWSMLVLLRGINWNNEEGSMSRRVRVSVTSSIQNVEQLESVSLAKWGSAGCL